MAYEDLKDTGTIEWDEAAEAEQERLNQVLGDVGIPESSLSALDAEIQEKLSVSQGEGEVVEERVLSAENTPRRLRVLWITSNASVQKKTGAVYERLLALSEHLEELHVVCIGEVQKETERVTSSFWVYHTEAPKGYFSTRRAMKHVVSEMVFGEGFRADVVVAGDMRYAGWLGYTIAERFDRMLNVYMESGAPLFMGDTPSRREQKRSRKLIAYTYRVRVPSEYAYAVFRHVYPSFRKEHIAITLPFFDVSRLEKYTQKNKEESPFPFSLLFVATPSNLRRLSFFVSVASFLLKEQVAVGLLVYVPQRYKQKVESVLEEEGITERVRFYHEDSDVLDALSESTLFVNVGADAQSETLLMYAAYLGVPVLTMTSAIAKSLFVDKESAFMCAPTDDVCFRARLGEFLNDNQLRTSLEINAEDRVRALVDTDKSAYYERVVDILTSDVRTYTQEHTSS